MDKRYVPVIIITLIILILTGAYAWFILWTFGMAGFPLWAKVLIALVYLPIAGALIWTGLARIREIRKGEENDLDQY